MSPSAASKALPTLRWVAGGLLILGVLSRCLGLVREILLAHHFGVSAELDSLYLGMSLPATITVALGSGMVRAGVAACAGLSVGRLSGLATVGVSRMAIVLTPLSVLLALISGFLAWVFLMTPQVVITPLVIGCVLASLTLVGAGVAGILSGVANAKGNHLGGAVTPLAYNVVLILTIVATHQAFGVLSLCLGFFLAEWVQVVCYAVALGPEIRGAKPQFVEADWSAWMSRLGPAVAAAALLGANQFVDRVFTAHLVEGSTAALSYADKLINMPAGLLGMALAVPLFTRLSKFRSEGRESAYRVTLLLGVRLMLFAGIPLGLLVLFLAEPIIGILLQRGAFDQHAVELCAQALRGYALGVPFISMSLLLIGASLTVTRPWRLVWWLLASVLLNAVLNAVLAPWFGVGGIALSSSVVAFIRVLVLLRLVCPEVLRSKNLLRSFSRVLISSLPGAAIAGVVAWNVDSATLEGDWNRLLVILACGLGFAVGCLVAAPLIRAEYASIGRMRSKAAWVNW